MKPKRKPKTKTWTATTGTALMTFDDLEAEDRLDRERAEWAKFAAAALAGIRACGTRGDMFADMSTTKPETYLACQHAAKWAACDADALLAEAKKRFDPKPEKKGKS